MIATVSRLSLGCPLPPFRTSFHPARLAHRPLHHCYAKIEGSPSLARGPRQRCMTAVPMLLMLLLKMVVCSRQPSMFLLIFAPIIPSLRSAAMPQINQHRVHVAHVGILPAIHRVHTCMHGTGSQIRATCMSKWCSSTADAGAERIEHRRNEFHVPAPVSSFD